MPPKKITDTEKPQDPLHEVLVKYCIDDLYKVYEKSEYRKAKMAEIKEARRTYEQKAEDTIFPWAGASNVVLPMETISVDNLEPRLIAGLTGKKPIIAFDPTGHLDEEGKILEKWFNDELDDVVRIEEVGRNIVHTLLIEGTRFSVVQYEKRKSIKREFLFDEQGNIAIDEKTRKPQIEEAEDTVFEGAKDVTIPFNDMYIPDDIGAMEEWEDADKIRKVRIPYGDLVNKKDASGYLNIGPWLLPEDVQKKLKEKDKSPSQQVAGVDVTGKDLVECIECHISYPIHNLKDIDEDTDSKERAEYKNERVIVTVALEAELVIRKILQRDANMNNQSVLKRQRLFPEEGRSFGTGIHGKMKAIQEGASGVFNRMMNVADVVLLPWYFYEENAGVQGRQEVKPGEGVKVEDISKIKFPEFKVNPGQYIEFLRTFFDLWERVMSISEPQIGKQKSEKTTATEIMAVIQEGNIKHNYQAETFKEEFLSIIRTMYDLYYQYMPYDKTIPYGGEMIPFPRAFMRRPNNFRLTGSTEMSNKLIERKENEDLFSMTINDPFFNPMAIREDLLKSYGRENTQKYLNPEAYEVLQLFIEYPEQVMQALAPIVQALQAAEAEQGGEGESRAAVQ